MTLAIGLQGGRADQNGSGKLTLGGVNSYAGSTNVLNGTLAIGPGVTLAGGAAVWRGTRRAGIGNGHRSGAKDTGSNPSPWALPARAI